MLRRHYSHATKTTHIEFDDLAFHDGGGMDRLVDQEIARRAGQIMAARVSAATRQKSRGRLKSWKKNRGVAKV